MSFAMDASAAAALAFDDERGPLEEKLQSKLEEGLTAYVPPNLHQELLEALLRGVRRERIALADASWLLSTPVSRCSSHTACQRLGLVARSATWPQRLRRRLSSCCAAHGRPAGLGRY